MDRQDDGENRAGGLEQADATVKAERAAELADILDVQAIQTLMDKHSRIAPMPMAILDLKGRVLVETGWQDICTKFHRAHPQTCKHCVESDTQLSTGVAPGEFRLYKCKNHMWDMVTPIVVSGQHVGNLFIGQFFFEDEPVDYELFRAQAGQYGFDEDEYLRALERVPRLSRETVETNMAFFVQLADQFSLLSHSNIRLARSLADHEALMASLCESQQQNEFLASVVKFASQAFGMGYPDGRIGLVNNAFEQLTGYTADELKTMDWTATLTPPEWRETERQKIEELRRTGRPVRYEKEYVRKDGTRVPIELLVHLVKGPDGQPLCYYSFITDITERKTREDRLGRLNRTLKALSDSNQALMRATDEAGLLGEICRIVVEGCGHAMVWIGFAEQDESRTVRPVAQAGFDQGYIESLKVTWADDERGRGPTGTAIRTGSPHGCGNMRTDPRFEPWREEAVKRGYASSVSVPLLAEGRAFGAVTIYSSRPDAFSSDEVELLVELANDLSYGLGAIRLRQAHARAEAAQRENERWLRLAQDAAKAGSWEWDLRTNENVWSEGLWKLYGLAPYSCTSSYETWRQAVYPDDRARVERAVQEAATRGAELNTEWRVRDGDGRQRWLMSRGQPVRDANGQVVRYIGIVLDITERKQAEEELNAAKVSAERAKAAAEEASAAKDRFLAVLSHELRTPLTPALMIASALEGDEAVPAWLRQDLSAIRRNIGLEVKLIDDLLELNRLARGKLILHLEYLDAHAKIAAAIELCRSEAQTKGVALLTDLAARAALVRGDAGRFQQVVWNLLKNAIKFTPAGGRVEVRSSNPAEGLLRIEVSDTGIGIEPEALPRLFNAFEQADQQITRQFGGLGLGLAISKALVELHGGRIRAASDGPGRGAAFTIELPITAPNRQTAAGAASSAVQPVRKLKILCVEDHTPTAHVLRRMLGLVGHEAVTAGSVCEARQLIESSVFDLLISDLGLPDGSGFEVMRELQARRPGAKGIALSGFGMESDIQRSKEAGFAEHLTKPVELRALQAAIARVVEPAS